MRTSYALVLSFILSCSAVLLFLALCWTAAADAQGAVALFFFAPVLAGLLAGSFFLAKYASGKFAKWISLSLAAFIIIFYVSPFVGAPSFSNGVIGLVAKSTEMLTGKSPMQWIRANRPVSRAS